MELETILSTYIDEDGYLSPLQEWASEHLAELEIMVNVELQKRGVEHMLTTLPGILKEH